MGEGVDQALVMGAAGGAALVVIGGALWAIRRRRNRREAAHELHRLLLARLLDYVSYMPGVSERDVRAAQAWLGSPRRFGGRVPYDQEVRLRRLLSSAEPDRRRRALLDVIDGPCVRIEESALGPVRVENGPVVEQVSAWLDSDPLDARIGETLAAAGCRVRSRGG